MPRTEQELPETNSYAMILNHLYDDIPSITKLVILYLFRSPIPKHHSYYNSLFALKRETIELG